MHNPFGIWPQNCLSVQDEYEAHPTVPLSLSTIRKEDRSQNRHDNKKSIPGLPRYSRVKNPPAKAGETGSISGPRRSHMLQSNQIHAPLLSPFWKVISRRVCALQQEKPLQEDAHTSQVKSSFGLPQLEKGCTQQWRPNVAINELKFLKLQNTWVQSYFLKKVFQITSKHT